MRDGPQTSNGEKSIPREGSRMSKDMHKLQSLARNQDVVQEI